MKNALKIQKLMKLVAVGTTVLAITSFAIVGCSGSDNRTTSHSNEGTGQSATLETARPLQGASLTGPTGVPKLGASLGDGSRQSWYIRFEGVEGESSDGEHKAWSDLLSFDSPVAIPNTPTFGTPELMVTKVVDKSSPILAQMANSRTGFKSVDIEFQQVYSSGNVVYYRCDLSNVVIVSYVTSGASTDGRPVEDLHLTYGQINITYTPVDATGRKGSPVTSSWSAGSAR